MRVRRYASVFLESLRIALSNATAYRASFVMTALIVFFGNVLFPLVTVLIYGAGASFPGWSFWEVLLIQGTFTMASGVSAIFFQGAFWQTNFAIREGTFEVTLLKPIDTLFAVMASSIQLEGLGTLLGGIAMSAVACARGAAFTPASVAGGFVLFLGGVAVMLAVTLVMSATAFKWVGNSRIPEIFDSVLAFAKYPQDIFPRAARGVTSFVIPVAMIGFFPASALLGKAQAAYYLALIPCALFLAAGIALYKAMIRRYEGVGG